MFRLFKKLWIPLLLVVVVALGAYVVLRVRDSFGANAYASSADANADDTKPFNPKHITYEITAPSVGSVNVNYLDQDGQPHLVENAPLPWSYTIVTTLPSMSANIVAQGDIGMRHLRCRVIVDGEVRDDRSVNEYEPFIYCLVKSV
ncbi:MmpS family transport accessory protein [Mycobacterium talmoniae]|uniref:Siderophore export accessory protein MmpS5 n=1 Tax=Mycobacterium talmoniae TaxID=1858794 RepID=A0A2S8BMP9_9MYCO|nr:MmpS family transport accessory protein [Mycobacterium talmoniae]PQM47957.1 Siderophore export accessory protein MmpS5 [Mycobacterium talmoniae]